MLILFLTLSLALQKSPETKSARKTADPHKLEYLQAKDAFNRAAKHSDDGVMWFEPAMMDLDRSTDSFHEVVSTLQDRIRQEALSTCSSALTFHRELLKEITEKQSDVDDLRSSDSEETGRAARARLTFFQKKLDPNEREIQYCVSEDMPSALTAAKLGFDN